MATAGEQITRALRLIGVLAEGELPSADMMSDALTTLNQMLDSWSTERLSIFTMQTQTYTWPAGDASHTLGPTGYFTGLRPVLLDPATYYSYSGIDYSLEIINEAQYNSIGLKSVGSSMPDFIYCDMAIPEVTLYLFPVPTADISLHIVSAAPLTQAGADTDQLVFPPGYLRAFAYNLACELAPEYGIEPSLTVKRIASSSKRNIKRINNPENVMSIPSALLPTPAGFNWYTGQP